MEPTTRQLLRRAFGAMGQAVGPVSPVTAALCEGLGQGPAPACEALFDQYFRTISAVHLNIPTFLAALHHLALTGEAAALARFFPSCGGSFVPADQPLLTAAAESVLQEHREAVLDFLLTHEPRDVEVRRAAAVLVGAMAAADRFGGGLSLLQLGAGDGLALLFDHYAYRIGDRQTGHSPLTLVSESHGPLPPWMSREIPPVVGRQGLGRAPVDLTGPAERLISAAFIAPDETERLERFHAACELLARSPRPDLRQGVPELDLAPLLLEAYNQMAPGNTLLLFSILAWSQLDDEAQKRIALAVQMLAAQIQPHKPIAWLQAEPFGPGGATLELRLHTFGWADLEDREVRKLAEAAPDLAWIRWLGQD